MPSFRASPWLFAIVLLALPLVHATHAGEHCYETADPEITQTLPDGTTYYVDNDMNQDFWSIWIYHESNGIQGLQRVDELNPGFCGCEPVPGEDDAWIDHDGSVVRGDTIIF